MEMNERKSDQLYNWSDTNDKRSGEIASTTHRSHTATSVNETAVSTRVANRALQEMWQTRVQVCHWSGTWTQILFIGKHSGCTSRDDLRTARVCTAGSSVFGKPDASAQAVGRDLRNQSRAVEKSGRLLRTTSWIRVQLIRLGVLICLQHQLSLPI